MKTCSHCRKKKPTENFHKNKASSDGKYAQCKKCVGARNLARRKKFPDEGKEYSRRHRKIFHTRSLRQRRASRLRRSYGLSEARYDQLLKAQNRKCLVCKRQMKKPCVDHDHCTGEIRGLLCSRCNVGLGVFDDSASLLRAAAAYLESALTAAPTRGILT